MHLHVSETSYHCGQLSLGLQGQIKKYFTGKICSNENESSKYRTTELCGCLMTFWHALRLLLYGKENVWTALLAATGVGNSQGVLSDKPNNIDVNSSKQCKGN